MINRIKELKFNKEEGFTIVELLVVVLIIGILSSIAVPNLLNQKTAAIDDSVESDLRQAVTLVEKWQNNNPRLTISNSSLAGIKLSEGTTVTVVSAGGAAGYVLCGKNSTGKDAATGIVYRSASGGMKAEAC